MTKVAAPETEIEITAEMTEAGISALLGRSHLADGDSPEAIVTEVYRDMENARICEIVITDGMIKAGVEAFGRRMANDGELVAYTVFKAMIAASTQFGKCRVVEDEADGD